MPPKKAGGTGNVGKVGNVKTENKQRRLTTEGGMKRVTFGSDIGKEMEELGKGIKEQVKREIKLLRKERNRYIEWVEEIKVKERKWENKIED